MASNKQRLEYTIAFTADTAKAKQQLQSLQTQLTSLNQLKFTSDGGGFGITKEVQSALTAVNQLQAQLNSAINVDTGKLDLGKFSQSLKSSGMSLASYRKQLEQLGPEGDQAFKTLAMSVANAEMPLRRTSQLMSDFALTMKNTLKWQISSSILHGLMSAMQSAYSYAEDLNASLNDIRIVTGYSADKMAEFSVEANKAAKALSATTKEYTNASLIYFQQGLSDSQVKERTDVTIKMANVTRESAETVSDQMTAVWNNFYDGSKSIEYYSDVMVKLGADTASSADEIATGLEKFAAVSNTVGLSYEYAASALTTITATTRQSADVVGTALILRA